MEQARQDPTDWQGLDWQGGRTVRAARQGETVFLRLSEVTSQARVYKQALDRFFRTEYRDWRPRWGDFEVDIAVHVQPGLPGVDLDNIAKAVLDGVTGALFFDDVQVARLLVERFSAAEEAIYLTVRRRGAGA